MTDRMSRGERVVVVGAGVSGLAAAHRLAVRLGAATGRRPGEVLVLEARGRPGGTIATDRRDGFLLEAGADAFITNKPAALDLCRALGLGDRLVPTDPAHRRSFVVHRGRLVPVPEGFVMMAPARLMPVLTSPLLSWRGKLRLLMERFVPRRDEPGEESLAAFARRRLGREVYDRLVQPLVGGLYTADPNDLSIEATLSRFPRMEREHGSLLRGARIEGRAGRDASGARYGLFMTLDEGMGRLPEALASALPPGALRLDAPVRRLARPDPDGPWRVELLDGAVVDAAAVVLTTEAHAAARLLDPCDAELARLLRAIPYASAAVVNIAYPRDAVAHPLDGCGVAVPAVEGRSILAASFSSVKFPGRAPAGTVLLRVYLGGAMQEAVLDRDDAGLVALVRAELHTLLGARGVPLLADVRRHPRAMPQYTLGHLDRVAAIRRRLELHPGLYLAGSGLDGVGLPDCVAAARTTADAVLAHLAAARRGAAA